MGELFTYKTENFMTDSKSIHIFKDSGNKINSRLHTHEFIEIVYIMSGKMSQTIDGQKYDVRRGDIIFMNYGCTHSFSADGDFSYINLLFSPQSVNDELVIQSNALFLLSLGAFNEMRSDASCGKISFWGREIKEIEDILCTMQKEYEQKLPSYESVLANYLNTLIVKMSRKAFSGLNDSEIDGMWRDLSEYIDQHLSDKLTMSDLAKKSFYNPSYFSRVFKEKFGVTFVEYVTRKRLDHAVKLLEESEISLDEVSRRSGFSDKNSFYYAFSHYLGAKPSQYRSGKVKK